MSEPMPLAVLVSGGGSNLQSLIDSIETGRVPARIVLVLANTPDAYGLVRAEKHGLPTAVVPHTAYPDRESHDRDVVAAIRAAGAEAVVLAGYMRLLSPFFIQAFPQRILNIHPALLPAFQGLHGQHQAAEYGVKLAGATVHFVDEELDNGPIIIQAAMPTQEGDDGDTLAQRILHLEHRIYPQAVKWLAEGRLQIRKRHVVVDNAPDPGPAPGSDASVCLFAPGLEPGM